MMTVLAQQQTPAGSGLTYLASAYGQWVAWRRPGKPTWGIGSSSIKTIYSGYTCG